MQEQVTNQSPQLPRPRPQRHLSSLRARGASGPRPDWPTEVEEAAFLNLHFLEADRVLIGLYAVEAELLLAAGSPGCGQKQLVGGARSSSRPPGGGTPCPEI